MIDFWLAAGLLLLIAAAFLLIPLRFQGTRKTPEQDRTALNVALYRERLQALEAQHAAATLTAAQLEVGRAEAARELLADTDEQLRQGSRLGSALPLLAVCLLPVLALALYWHLGASQQLALSREFAQPPKTQEELSTRLEKAVQVQPESAEAWYFLGRTYMTQNREADAAKAFQEAAERSARPAEILGMWAQALYFSGNKTLTPQISELTTEALQKDPQEVTTLGLLGIAAFEEQRYAQAIDYWGRLAALLPAEDPSREAITGGIERARQRLKERGETLPVVLSLSIKVELSPALKQQVAADDSVFVFARALSGPPMPLAVKRLKVADLPALVQLTDADALVPELKLSSSPEVQLAARISREGNATQGQWIGRTGPVSTQQPAEQQLMIDSPEHE